MAANSSLTVVVTGAGGPAGVAVIRALHLAGHTVVGVDSDPSAVGLRLSDGSAVISRADDPGFAEQVCELSSQHRAEALIATVAEELEPLTVAKPELDSCGVATWFPAREAVRSCIDKWAFSSRASAVGAPVPPTALGSAAGVPGPWVVKPRFGRGSRDLHLVKDEAGLAYALSQVPEPLVQTQLAGTEFTADVLISKEGILLGAVPRWRLETRGGISTKGETFSSPELVVELGRLVKGIGLTGPANVQGFVDKSGSISFTEINPRFSGGLPLSLAAGADLVGEYLRGIMGRPPRAERLRYRSGVTMMRYFEEVFEG
ncbi:MAG: ATP-grasp domain-containing protein [Actinobacteria bacterium]|nr:ATP-grasp domain-containing protein [Actinomycetota bacterium]